MTKIALSRPNTKLKMRLSAIKRMNARFGQTKPNYSPIACQKIDEYGKQHGLNFQHAMNGGEFYIKGLGYWVDGYDRNSNVVIEYYEKRHNTESRKVHDLKRKQEIRKSLGCKFVELREWKLSNELKG
jgi:hypothetical protein